MNRFLQDGYYQIKPLIPKRIRLFLRRKYLHALLPRYRHVWPINEDAGNPPKNWQGWPEGKKFALVLTHDVEEKKGLSKCRQLAELEMELGFRSSFNFVAEDYEQDKELRQFLTNNAFEIGLHGLTHKKNTFRSRKVFLEQAPRLNRYLQAWNSDGFRGPSMHRNLDWFHDLQIQYDATTFDTDPFEPQPGGVGTIFPFWISRRNGDGGYVELPYTLPQDFTLFILMQEKDDAIWRKKLDWIAQKGGTALVIAHPDYMYFTDSKKKAIDEYNSDIYRNFLQYIKDKYHNQYWHLLPCEMARFWRHITLQPDAAGADAEIRTKLYQTSNHTSIDTGATAVNRQNIEIAFTNPLLDPRWDQFVNKHPRGWIVHLSGWQRVLENNFPHMNGHYLTLIDKSNGQIRAGLPIYEIHSWLTGKRMVSIPFATISEPLASTAEEMDLLLTGALDLFEKNRFSYMEIKALDTGLFLKQDGFFCDNFFQYHYIDLTQTLDTIWKNLNYKSVRYEINKSKKSSLKLSYATTVDDVSGFYRLYAETRKGLGLPAQPLKFFLSLWNLFSKTGNVFILFAKVENNVAAAHLLFDFNGRVSVEAIGWDMKYTRTSPNHFLFWHGITLAHEKGRRIFDFGRTSPNNQSLMDFKKRWGTIITDLPSYYYPITRYEKGTDRDKTTAYKAASFACQKAPDLFYNQISKFCYRHLG